MQNLQLMNRDKVQTYFYSLRNSMLVGRKRLQERPEFLSTLESKLNSTQIRIDK